jgi:DNA segregation ATPase FtsK/SpoIIIE-like protein
MINKRRIMEATAVAQRVPEVLRGRGLTPAFQDWPLTEHNGLLWLFGVLDLQHIEKLERYTDASLLHHISTVLGGLPVFLSNTSGLRYAILLSQPPQLPDRIDYPGLKRGLAQLGRKCTGGGVAVLWEEMRHLLVAGMTGAGKSNFLRLIAYQGLAEGHRLLLADMDGATFPMLAGHEALLEPLARDPQGMLEIVERALGECEHRAELYAQVSGFPDNLPEYNELAVKAGVAPLPRLLVILDEFNSAVTSAGGARGTLSSAAAELGWRGRKFGINLVFAAQDFSKSVVGRVRDQVGAAICFRVRSRETARAMRCEQAAKIAPGRPGLAVTDRWGPMQAYFLDKALLIQAGRSRAESGLSEAERAMVRWAMANNEGYLPTRVIREQLGAGYREARSLAEDWELRGWLAKNAGARNTRQVTAKLEALV